MVKRFHAVVTGKVQGVFYRASAQKKAIGLNVKGFVRNLPNGSVELEAEGELSSLEAFLEWSWIGPPDARVEDVKVEWIPSVHESNGFLILD